MKTIDYREGLLKRLRNQQYATKLLKHSFEESCRDGNWEAFGIVLQDVISAQGNTVLLQKKRGLAGRISTESLARTLIPR
jgi:hypothetical protein